MIWWGRPTEWDSEWPMLIKKWKETKKKKKKKKEWLDEACWDSGWPMLVFTHMNFVSLQHNILSTPMFCAFYNWFKMVFTLWSCSIILFVSSLIALNSWVLDMKLLFLLGGLTQCIVSINFLLFSSSGLWFSTLNAQVFVQYLEFGLKF